MRVKLKEIILNFLKNSNKEFDEALEDFVDNDISIDLMCEITDIEDDYLKSSNLKENSIIKMSKLLNLYLKISNTRSHIIRVSDVTILLIIEVKKFFVNLLISFICRIIINIYLRIMSVFNSYFFFLSELETFLFCYFSYNIYIFVFLYYSILNRLFFIFIF